MDRMTKNALWYKKELESAEEKITTLSASLKEKEGEVAELREIEEFLEDHFEKCEFKDACDDCKLKTPMQSWTRLSSEGEAEAYWCTICALKKLLYEVEIAGSYAAYPLEEKIAALESSMREVVELLKEIKTITEQCPMGIDKSVNAKERSPEDASGWRFSMIWKKVNKALAKLKPQDEKERDKS